MLTFRRFFVAPMGVMAALVLLLAAVSGPAGADEGDNRHPSGKDRSVEQGGSGTQGRSPSDPDGMSNGGMDKPGGSGGIDTADQDGNNGCGNDDDFEDDNNGNCLGRLKAQQRMATQRTATQHTETQQTKTETGETTEKTSDTAILEQSTETSETSDSSETTTVRTDSTVNREITLFVADRLEGSTATETVETEVLGVGFEREVTAAGAPASVDAEQAVVASTEAGAGSGSGLLGALARTGLAIISLLAIAAALIAFGIAARRASTRA